MGDLDAQTHLQAAREWFLKAVAVAEEAAALDPTDLVFPYDLACAHARLADSAAALADLDRAVTNGWIDVDRTSEDADLASLRDLPAFQTLLERMRAKAANE